MSFDVVSPGGWLVSSIWFLLSSWQVAIGSWANSASLCRVVRVVFTRQQLQLCLVRSSLSRVGQFSFEYCPLSHEAGSRIHNLPCFGRLACPPTPDLRRSASPDLCSGLVQLLWEIGLSPQVCSQPLLLSPFLYWEFGPWPCLHSLGQVQCSTPTSTVTVRL
jgi:hypothetical protein